MAPWEDCYRTGLKQQKRKKKFLKLLLFWFIGPKSLVIIFVRHPAYNCAYKNVDK